MQESKVTYCAIVGTIMITRWEIHQRYLWQIIGKFGLLRIAPSCHQQTTTRVEKGFLAFFLQTFWGQDRNEEEKKNAFWLGLAHFVTGKKEGTVPVWIIKSIHWLFLIQHTFSTFSGELHVRSKTQLPLLCPHPRCPKVFLPFLLFTDTSDCTVPLCLI